MLKAIEEYIPAYTFIEQKVWHDHQLYQKNKNKDIIKQIDFPSIDKKDTAEYIFEFINFVRIVISLPTWYIPEWATETFIRNVIGQGSPPFTSEKNI